MVKCEGQRIARWVGFVSLLLVSFIAAGDGSSEKKVLVVMSYEESFSWTQEVKQGIDDLMLPDYQLTYFYMDTKQFPQGGRVKAEQALALYRDLQPQGVIAVDDNAQQLFVVPFLKDQVPTPVMFAGVNAAAQTYGYPAGNVSGILERGHVRESIAFLKQLQPEIRNIGFIAEDSPSGRAVLGQINEESAQYDIDVCSVSVVETQSELQALARDIAQKCDAVYMDGVGGITDAEGNLMSYSQVLQTLQLHFNGPVLGANRYHVAQGALAAVVKTGQEQGRESARMLLHAMDGIAVEKLPITRNFRGRRLLNVSTMKAMGIQPRPITIRGVELVRTH